MKHLHVKHNAWTSPYEARAVSLGVHDLSRPTAHQLIIRPIPIASCTVHDIFGVVLPAIVHLSLIHKTRRQTRGDVVVEHLRVDGEAAQLAVAATRVHPQVEGLLVAVLHREHTGDRRACHGVGEGADGTGRVLHPAGVLAVARHAGVVRADGGRESRVVERDVVVFTGELAWGERGSPLHLLLGFAGGLDLGLQILLLRYRFRTFVRRCAAVLVLSLLLDIFGLILVWQPLAAVPQP